MESTGRRLASQPPLAQSNRFATNQTTLLSFLEAERAALASVPFQFGYGYTHFFYTMEAKPPYRTLATSNEWCIGSEQDPNDCESVQFVSGIALTADGPAAADASGTAGAAAGVAPVGAGEQAGTLLLSYGINDCEARIARMDMARVWAMLRPLEGEADVCS